MCDCLHVVHDEHGSGRGQVQGHREAQQPAGQQGCRIRPSPSHLPSLGRALSPDRPLLQTCPPECAPGRILSHFYLTISRPRNTIPNLALRDKILHYSPLTTRTSWHVRRRTRETGPCSV